MSLKGKLPSQLVDLLPVQTDKKTYEEYYNEASTKAIRSLIDLLSDKRIQESVKKTDDPSTLHNPAYVALQAYQSGYRQAYAELKDLINR